MKSKTLVVVTGPTAVGKTALCVELAQALQTEIVSADARQIYREMRIGTARPTQEEMGGVVHHFIASHSIHDNYSAGKYEADALRLLSSLFERYDTLLLTGGSGLYIKAVCSGLDNFPEIPPSIRQQLQQELEQKGLESLQKELLALDPESYAEIDLQNPRRVLRALEVCRASGRPYAYFKRRAAAKRPFRIVGFVLHRPRPILYKRINQRVDMMMQEGLWEEAQALFPFRHLTALQTVGYQELFEAMEGKYDRSTAVELIKRNTRRYAKRQLTWFRHQHPAFEWIDMEGRSHAQIIEHIVGRLHA
ncbi:MAG: tRNA dimethylallyltransferase 1 [Thermonema sp.]|uniref:tRNA (adenosine(37)-N6)-dimethylallyltransferase MiaA n=1 Tax=Thermonema sp. TaxID=2231181 RepID=UPI0021DF3BC3|nr:tRNA (adenosine(37)-N6)-dimethylallyltransferase MiaA [Thermonema sp.]GIV39644.1 MAG: tRNA dimethylallyltransferase 1 [Thermonema sp.]